MVKAIEKRPHPATIALGFLLLALSEEGITSLTKGIEMITNRARTDGKNHDIAIGFGVGASGITIHCNSDPVAVAGPRLQKHCEGRKYIRRTPTWFGVCIVPADGSLRFGINLDYEWEQSTEMDAKTKNVSSVSNFDSTGAPITPKPKVGRNDRCPCGSGKKHKKCCL